MSKTPRNGLYLGECGHLIKSEEGRGLYLLDQNGYYLKASWKAKGFEVNHLIVPEEYLK